METLSILEPLPLPKGDTPLPIANQIYAGAARRKPLTGKWPVPVLVIESKVIAARYVQQVLDQQSADKFQVALETVLRLRQAAQDASPTIHAGKMDAARRAYATDPSASNFKDLRDLQALVPNEQMPTFLYQLQAEAHRQLSATVHKEISPMMPSIYEKLADLLEWESAKIREMNEAIYAMLQVPAAEHPMAQSLNAIAEGFRRMAEYAGNSTELPAILEELLDAWNDLHRPER